MILTDSLLLHYKRCQRRAFLDLYGNLQEKEPIQDFVLKLQQESRSFQEVCLADLAYQKVQYPRGDTAQGFAATLDLMQQGVAHIVDGVLQGSHSSGAELVAYPQVLVRREGDSRWGGWYYVPMNIKLGKRPKAEYQVVISYQVHLLTQIQGRVPDRAWLMLRGKPQVPGQGVTPYSVDLSKWLPVTKQIVDECIQALSQDTAPELFISRQRCGLCPWYRSCYAQAQAEEHLSLLAGVTPNRYQQLQACGLTTKEAIAQTKIADLEPVMGRSIATTLIHQAQAIVTNQAILQRLPHQPLPVSEIELYFDIEAEPELNLDYLLGVLVVDKVAQTKEFYAFLAETPEQEDRIWQQFLALVQSYPRSPIYHFSDYELETVKRLAHIYGMTGGSLGELRSRFIDLHTIVTNTVILPVEGYSLKQVAKWIGFRWRDPQTTGADCVCLYDQWLLTGDCALLEQVRRYNEDDCLATHRLKDWLENFWHDSLQLNPQLNPKTHPTINSSPE